MGIGVAHFFARRFEDAKVTLLQSLQEKPNWVPTFRFLASCYVQMGRLDEARETVTRLRTLTNIIVLSSGHWRHAPTTGSVGGDMSHPPSKTAVYPDRDWI